MHLSSPVKAIGALAAWLGAAACSQAPAAQAPPAPVVTVAEVEERAVTDWEELNGRLAAVESVEVKPRVTGYIQRVAFTEGAEVKKGDLLFQIDPRPYRTELLRAKADLAQARSSSVLATRDLARVRALLAAEAITTQEFERGSSTAERGVGAVQGAEAAVTAAQLNLEWTEVRAPIAGRVGRAEVTVGNLVQSGAPSPERLTTVVSLDPIHVAFEADERTFLKLAAGQRTAGKPAAPRTVLLGLANEEGFPHRGQIDFVDNQLDPRTGTVRARAVFSNADRRFTPGLFARLRLEGGAQYPARLVSDRAIATDQDKKFVLVLKPDSTLEYRPVQLGPLVDGYRVVTDGLRAGERIVINGLQRVRPGMKVNATSAPMLAEADLSPR